MIQPEGFVDPKDTSKYASSSGPLNGLVQASRSWNIHFDEMIKDFGFVQGL